MNLLLILFSMLSQTPLTPFAGQTPVINSAALQLAMVGQLQVAQAPVVQQPAQTPSIQQTQATLPQDIPEGWKLGPGDLIQITVWDGKAEQTQTVFVAADSTVYVPFSVNKLIHVENLDTVGLREAIIDELKKNFVNPNAQVIQTQYNSKRGTIAGEVPIPGSYTITGATRVLDMIMNAKGWQPGANVTAVQVTRGSAQGSQQITANILDVLLGTDVSQNIKLEPGDVVYVPSIGSVSNKIFLIIEGRGSQVMQTAEKVNLLEVLTRGSAIGPQIKLNQVGVIRYNMTTGKTEHQIVNFTRLLKSADLSMNVPLENGDVVYVPRGGIVKINEIVGLITPVIGFIRDTILFTTAKRGGGGN